ncbi:paraquat-inducible protein A, partial [Candidatus Magnetaquicoccus inordinatus]|uniref:paraquat-inducible protein A n=1 Tax=Candidatus Magnetaquicoccus inordinatus TaxID=2496818 RepID=UPI001D0E719A
PGIALYAYCGLLLATCAAALSIDPQVRRRFLAPDVHTEQPLQQISLPKAAADDPLAIPSARELGLLRCECCSLLVYTPPELSGTPACPHCGTPLHVRKTASLTVTWALLLTATLLYLPANMLPIMTVIRFGQGNPDTILSGIQHLLENGLWPLALLIFYASIVVPMMKLLILSFLLLSIHMRSSWRPKERTTLYRIIESFGHWSMVDIFLISILTALVQLGTLSTIEPGMGATFFGLVVVTTMLATQRFDPRLIWDALEQPS